MATELRSYYSDAYIQLIADELSKTADINSNLFKAEVLGGNWVELSLKERSARLTQCLVNFLPDDPHEGIAILKSLLPKISGDAQKYADMLCIFIPDYVSHYKNTLPLEDALDALCYFTSNGTTSELAVRPFLLEHPSEVLSIQRNWLAHEHPHVRRWISEGCRPRLPWAPALPQFKIDPKPILQILDALVEDTSKFVQKSVANNLNDISKDNPEIALQFAENRLGKSPQTDWILKHGLRGLLKSGNPKALALFGAMPVKLRNPKLTLELPSIHLGQSQTFDFSAHIDAPLPSTLRLEYAMDFRKANGLTSRKIFMISEKKPADPQIQIRKSHKFVDYTTRRHYSGQHSITILVNGAEVASHDFDLIR
ncbi:DNA alkylation repair protein [Sneathiella glossodoripedis]|uniref:DNA alkylation repair protein n=1 Tax=Sneathiella glossodoripedis TaxID=418853 RepID=UPI0004715907|nr:DNA alkylation repair protein [Sneathiella glossodoripedis]